MKPVRFSVVGVGVHNGAVERSGSTSQPAG